MSTFELLHDKVQKFVYKKKWEAFRPIQDDAISFLKNEVGHLLICAPTASGKTEAAFLPIISSIADDFNDSYRVLYISPLKALINDQFRRVDEICADIGIPVTKWHGDVGQTLKRKSIDNPRGVLLITPESVEAMLVRKPQLAASAFSKLQFVVIDEVHSFIGTERGAQLYSLINRIRFLCGCRPRIVALSATIGNPEHVAKWISNGEHFKVIEDNDWVDDGGVEGIIKGYVLEIGEEAEGDEKEPKSLLSNGLVSTLYLDFLNGKNLVFGNSKKKLEETAFEVANLARERNSRTDYLIHHGSLSKDTRELAEKELKETNHSTTVFCTSTLEMGIDIGKIEKIGLIDPPWTVSGFAQRVGRSGRREGSTKKFEFLIQQSKIHADANLSEALREDLVKSVAIVNLYLEGFKEPLSGAGVHFSTLIHQILSYCTQRSGANPGDLKKVILSGSFSSKISEDEFDSLIDHLVEKGILFRESLGDLLPGRIGEKIADHYEFYSVFQSSENWSVVNDGQLIGEIPVIGTYKSGDHLLLAGRVWKVLEVNDSSRRIAVAPAKRAKAPLFNASFGTTHERIHEEMRKVYESEDEILFLDEGAKQFLVEGRQKYREVFSEQSVLVKPIFEGTVVQNTISSALDLLKIEHGITECALEIRNAETLWLEKLEKFFSNIDSDLHLAQQIDSSRKYIQKFDQFLPVHLLNKSYAEIFVNVSGAKEWLTSLKF